MSIISIAVDQIDASDRLRAVNKQWVTIIADSLCEQGLVHPITVSNKQSDGSYKLLTGMHRVEAAKMLGWEEISATVVAEPNELKRRLFEIDENLFRHELTPLDRAHFLAQRQEIYELMHPGTQAGVAGGLARHGLQTKNFSFAENVSEKMGLSPRVIQMNIRRAKKIDPKVRDMIATTWIAEKGSELDALTKLEPKEQLACVKAVLRDKNPAKNIKAALVTLKGEKPDQLTPDEKDLADLKKLYVRVSDKTRGQFRAWLSEVEE